MKKQIAPHLERLKTLAENGDERAQEKFVALQIKIKQIDAVLPYLEKCISKNKEAEQKTIAILEKKRDEELAALEEGTSNVTLSTDKNEGDAHTSTSDLYMKVLSDSHNLGDSSRINGIFKDEEEARPEIIDHSTPQHQPEPNTVVGSRNTPHSTGSLMMDSLLTPIIPVYNTGSNHEQSSIALDDTITSVPVVHDSSIHTTPIEAYTSSQSSHNTQLNSGVSMVEPVSTTQGLPMQTVLPMGTNTTEPTPHVVPDHGVQLSSRVSVDSTSQYASPLSPSSEPPPPAAAVVTMSEPRHSIIDNKPPPIRPKKKKVPPPRPPRRSSSCGATTANMINLEDSPASPNRRQSADANIPPAVPMRSSANINKRTSDLIGSDLDNVSVFSKIKV